MQKSKILEQVVGAALLGGAFYFIFYTERGIRLRERMLATASNTLDELLALLEEELADAEAEELEEA